MSPMSFRAPRRRRRVVPARHALFFATATALWLGYGAAAMAQQHTDLQAETRRAAWTNQWLARTFAPPASAPTTESAPPVAAAADPGVIGNPHSWRTDEFKADWGLAAMGAEYAYARGLTGNGVSLGQFDSGVDLQHPEFQGRNHVALDLSDPGCSASRPVVVFAGQWGGGCVSSKGDEPTVDASIVHQNDGTTYNYVEYGSHGTHVAGTMVANRDGQGMHGVAFGSRLVTAKLFSDALTQWTQAADGNWSNQYLGWSAIPYTDQVKAFYTQTAALGARAVNVEIWNPVPNGATIDDVLNQYSNEKDHYDAYADAAIRTGILTVVALGNDNGNIANIYPGLPAFRPDAEPYWLSVANVKKEADGSFVINESSSICAFTKQWCISAPGTDITSSVLKNIVFNRPIGGSGTDADPYTIDIGNDPLEHGYADYTGTSMAAPHAIGALGLLFERFPYLTATQVRDVLLTTAKDLGDPGVDDIYGWGMIDLKKAIEGPGLLRVDTHVVMNQQAGGAHVWNDARVWDDWTNAMGGPGRLSFTSANGGWLRLSGANTFKGATIKSGTLEFTGSNQLTGDVQVDGGTLRVEGTLDGSALTVNHGNAIVNGRVLNADTQINADGLLQGNGTLGNTTVAGSIAPGMSIGTLTVNGRYVQQAGSKFFVEMQPPSATDKVVVNGKATLNGGTVVALRSPGVFGLGQSYNFLTATQGVTGTFAGVDNSALGTFLQMSLRYDANNAYADVIRAAALATVAKTTNQRQTAGALDSLANSRTLLQALVLLQANQAVAAFDQLSGELHPGLRNMLAEDGRHVRNAALARARTGQDAFTSQSAMPGFSAWMEAVTGSSQLDSDGNAALLRASGQQTLIGADYRFDGGMRLGLFGGGGRSDTAADQQRGKASMHNRTVGLYVGQQWGAFGLRGGFIQSNHDIDTQRNIAFPGIAQQLRGQYGARTQQAFIEGGYLFGDQAWQVEPYLQYARVKVQADAFTETGGTAALHADSGSSTLGLTTIGLRGSMNLKGSQQEQTWLSLRGGLAYRQVSGDRLPATVMGFIGSNAFTVFGTAMPNSAVIGEVGMAARLSERALLELGYSGQFSGEGRDHGANARFSLGF